MARPLRIEYVGEGIKVLMKFEYFKSPGQRSGILGFFAGLIAFFVTPFSPFLVALFVALF